MTKTFHGKNKDMGVSTFYQFQWQRNKVLMQNQLYLLLQFHGIYTDTVHFVLLLGQQKAHYIQYSTPI